jgi:hypothetical protein
VTNTAAPRQLEFVRDLLGNREAAAEVVERITSAIDADEYTKAQASADIDALLELPRRESGVPSPFQALLASVPKSKYAVPTALLEASDAEDDFRGDLVFLELKEFMGTLYVRQLHGAPGRFTRSPLTATQIKALVTVVKTDPYKFAKMFGDHYACCGSCGAELTDQRSRELMLGPECRKKFGY